MTYNYNGSGVFAPSGDNYLIQATGNASTTATELKAAGAVQILADQNVAIAFNAYDDSFLPSAVFPTTPGVQGEGSIIQKDRQTVIAIPGVGSYNTTGVMYVAVASDVTANVYISLGDLV